VIARLRERVVGDRITRDSLVVLTGQGISLVLGLGSSAALARGLGPDGVRILSIVSATVAIGITISDLGLSTSVVREIARQPSGGAVVAARGFARIKLGASILVALLMIAMARPLAGVLRLPQGSGRVIVWLAATSVVATSVSGIMSSILHGLRRFRALAATQVLNFGLTLLLMGGLFLSSHLFVQPALWVGIGTALAGAAAGFVLLPRAWRACLDLRGSGVRSPETRRMLSFGSWLWVGALFSIVASQLDLLLLNRWRPGVTVGFYALALNLYLKASVLYQTLRMVLLPEASSLSGAAEYRSYLKSATTRCVIVAGGALITIPLMRPFVLVVYGRTYLPSVKPLYTLTLIVVFDLVTLPLILLAYPLGMSRVLAAADAARVITLLACGSLLIPAWGIYGAVVAKLAAQVVAAVIAGGAVIRVIRRVRGPAPDGSSAPSPPLSLPT
jgi:O-antigen/teichoic acid export membrane protein